jgi:hypothetical protein
MLTTDMGIIIPFLLISLFYGTLSKSFNEESIVQEVQNLPVTKNDVELVRFDGSDGIQKPHVILKRTPFWNWCYCSCSSCRSVGNECKCA